MKIAGDQSLLVLILTHEPFVIFSHPCAAEEGHDSGSTLSQPAIVQKVCHLGHVSLHRSKN